MLLFRVVTRCKSLLFNSTLLFESLFIGDWSQSFLVFQKQHFAVHLSRLQMRSMFVMLAFTLTNYSLLQLFTIKLFKWPLSNWCSQLTSSATHQNKPYLNHTAGCLVYTGLDCSCGPASENAQPGPHLYRHLYRHLYWPTKCRQTCISPPGAHDALCSLKHTWGQTKQWPSCLHSSTVPHLERPQRRILIDIPVVEEWCAHHFPSPRRGCSATEKTLRTEL